MEKFIPFILFFISLPQNIYAQQDCYNSEKSNYYTQLGNEWVKQGEYKVARQYYDSAKVYCKDKIEEVEELLTIMEEKIENEQRNSRSMRSFSFYDEKFALTYDEKYIEGEGYKKAFFFIDKKMREIKHLGYWKKAERFEMYGDGFVEVYDWQDIVCYLDTLGGVYPVAYNLKDLEENPNITALDLSEKQWEHFPKEIFNYPQLEVLIINGKFFDIKHNGSVENNFIEIPAEISILSKLKNLQLEHCQIQKLPPELGQLKQLETLILDDNQLTALPAELGNLKKLKTLNLSGNLLTDLPTEFGNLQNLQWLKLIGNQLSTLSPEFGNLQNLQWLELYHNQLSTLPPEFGNLQNLQRLELSDNNLVFLPSEFGQLQSLHYLNLGNNQILSIPSTFGELQNLQDLHIYDNKLSSLPSELFQLQTLKNLSLFNNELSSLPPKLGQLSSLQELHIANNQLSSLPYELGQLQNLELLNLGGNPISENKEVAFETYGWLTNKLPNCIINGLLPQMYDDYYFQQDVVDVRPYDDTAWTMLSFYALFVEEYEVAIDAAQKSLELNPNKQGVEIYLAMAYLLNNQWQKAKVIVLKWKGKECPWYSEKTYDEVFIELIEHLEYENVSHSNFEKLRKLLSE